MALTGQPDRNNPPNPRPSGRQIVAHRANGGQTGQKKSFESPDRDDRPSLAAQMGCANAQLAHLPDADNRISPEEHVALQVGFGVPELHRKDSVAQS